MTVAVAVLPLFFSFTLASFIVDPVTKAALTCEPVLLQWQGGIRSTLDIASVFKISSSVVASDGSVIENFGKFTGTSFHWTVDVDAGTVVAAQVTDSTGAIATGKSFTVQPGTTGCTINQNKFAAPPPTSSTSDTGTSVSAAPPLTSSSSDTGTSVSAAPISPTPASASSQPSKSSILPLSSSPQPSNTGIVVVSAPPTASGSMQYVSADPSPSSPVSAITASSSHVSRVGMAFAILIPCLIVLVIVGFLLLRWRRRRREVLSALEAQPQWFNKPSYQGAWSNPESLEIAIPEVVEAPPQRPTLNIVPPANSTTTGPQTANTRTPGTEYLSATTLPSGISPLASSEHSSKYVETLHSRIDALLAENAILAELASPHVDLPPPAYA
ncbi:hypothetical protein MVEN_00759300 [Mycena venus]|uniref:Dystroglycan-type cadherin-like domain-containing protein n=1 Tax=Mycena venus TaxID=2733690 RepID=A0A8H6YJT9_9AGAR|nr:hypothetical protein MVEN_00759300 [Mycena venus]